jgi:hypothetical protein
VVLLVLAALGCTTTILVFSPGYVSSGDSLYQLQQALGRVPLSDWHPPVMSLLWRALIALTGTQSSMAVLQSVVLWAALLVIAWRVWEVTGRRDGSLAILGLGLAPQVLTFVGVVWKDTHMAFAFLATVAAALAGTRLRSSRSALRWALFGVGLLFLVYGILVRKNAVFAALPLFVMLVLALWPKPVRRTWLVTSAALVLGILLPSMAITSFARPVHTSQVSQVMLDDLLHVPSIAELRSADVSPDLRRHLVSAAQRCRQIKPISNAYWWCYGKGEHGPFTAVAHTDEIRSLWLTEIPRHFPGYVEYRVQVFSRLLFKTRYEYSGRMAPNDLGLRISHPRLEDTLSLYVKEANRDLPMLFQGWFWLAVGLVLSFRPGRGAFSMPVRALGISSAVYILGYLPILPVGIYRYVYWPAVAGSLGLLLLWLGRRHPSPREQAPEQVPQQTQEQVAS